MVALKGRKLAWVAHLREPFARRLGLIVAGGFLVRLIYTLTIADQSNGEFAMGDLHYYHEIANLIASGSGYINPREAAKGISIPSAEHPPLWPSLLAAESKLGGNSMLAHRLAGTVVGGGVIAIVGLLGRRVAGERIGLVAAGLATAYPILIAADGSLMSESLYGLGIAVALVMAYWVRERPTVARSAALGAAIGATALVRPEVLLLLFILGIPLLCWRRGRSGALRWAVACIAAAAVLSPWTIRNAFTFDAFVLVSTNQGSVLRGANCTHTYEGPDLGFWTPRCLTIPRGRNEWEVTKRWRREGLDYARNHLGRLALVLPVRELRTWGLYQPRRQLDFAEGRNKTMEGAGTLVFYLFAPLAVAGAVALRRRGEPLLILASPFAMVALVSLTSYGYTRFRHAAEIPLLVLVAIGIQQVASRVGGSRAQADRDGTGSENDALGGHTHYSGAA